jgi:AmmeMemoRadiSam system protein B
MQDSKLQIAECRHRSACAAWVSVEANPHGAAQHPPFALCVLHLNYDSAMTTDVRPAAVAGSWYPSTPERLAQQIDQYMANADIEPSTPPGAIVAPHAGLMYSGPVAAFAYRTVAGADYAAVILVGPSHFVGFQGVSIWPRGAWQTPFGAVPVAEDLAADIAGASHEVIEHPVAHGREHSLELQLPFVAHLLPGVPIVPLVMGRQSRATAFALGDALATVVARVDGRVLLVASSDLSHYHDAPTAAAMDAVVLRHVEQFDADGLMRTLEDEPHHACGGGPMVSVIRAAIQLGCTRAQVLKYADSGDVSGDKSSVVGYMAAAVW